LSAREMGWLTAVEDGLRDVGGEIAEADQPREIRPAHAFLLGQCRKGSAGAADEGGVETMRPHQQLDQPRVGFGYGTRIVAVVFVCPVYTRASEGKPRP